MAEFKWIPPYFHGYFIVCRKRMFEQKVALAGFALSRISP